MLLVDDMAVFRARPVDGSFRPTEWPTVDDVADRLADSFTRHEVSEVDDVLVARPRR